MPGFAASRVRLVRAALVGTALGSAMVPGVAWASCAITAGSGTVASPAANSTVTCTGSTTGLQVSSAADGVSVNVQGGATVTGNAGDAVVLTGQGGTITLQGPTSTVRDLTITNTAAAGSTFSGLFLQQQSLIENFNTANTIAVTGTNARLSVTGGSQVTTASTITLEGTDATLNVTDGGRLEGLVIGFAGPLVRGGAGSQTFVLDGQIVTDGSSGTAWFVDAGDGDDTITVTGNTSLLYGTLLVNGFANKLVTGGNGFDTLNLDGSAGDGRWANDTTDIEALRVFGAAEWELGGTQAFTYLEVGETSTLLVESMAALGQPGATVNLRFTNPALPTEFGRLVLTDPAGGTFQQVLTGGGEIAFENGGTFVVTSASPNFTGTVRNTQAFVRVENSQAFGSAAVINEQNGLLELGNVTLANHLSGEGILRANGTSSTLDNAGNTFSGGISVISGRLVATSVGALGNGNLAANTLPVIDTGAGTLQLALGANGNLDPASTAQRLSNRLLGSGGLLKTGQGNLVLTRAQPDFTGAVTLSGGRTMIDIDGALGSGTITLSGGGLVLGNVAVLGNRLAGSGSVEKSANVMTTLTADNSQFNANYALNAGVLAATTSGNFGAAGSNATIGANASIRLTNAADEVLGLRVSSVAGLGTFRKAGAGLLTIADLFQVGTFAIDAGRVRVNQTITASTTVASGARLDGTGRIIGTLTNNGTVAPGNSIGTLTVQGNYVHNAGSVLEIEFNGSGGIDLLDVTGNVTLNGGTLRFVSLGGAEGNGGTFLKAGGTLTGTFATVETVGAQLPLAVIYQPSSAIMAPSVLTARPSTFNAQSLAAAETAGSFAELIDTGTPEAGEGGRLWLQGLAADGRRNASGATLAYGHDSKGLAGGVSFAVAQGTTLGVAVGWSDGDIALAGNAGGGAQQSVLGGVHLRHQGDGFVLGGGAFAGSVDQRTARVVSFNGFTAVLDGETDSKLLGGFVRAGADFATLGSWTLGGHARLAWIRQSQDGYTENGTSPLRLAVPDLKTQTLSAEAGLDARMALGDGGGVLQLSAGARSLSNLGDRAIPVSFVASNAPVVLQGDTRDAVHGYARVGLALPLAERVLLHAGYAGQMGQADRHEGRLGLSIAF